MRTPLNDVSLSDSSGSLDSLGAEAGRDVRSPRVAETSMAPMSFADQVKSLLIDVVASVAFWYVVLYVKRWLWHLCLVVLLVAVVA
jgi:hypothetical protein